MLAEAAAGNDTLLEPALWHLRQNQHASIDEVAAALSIDKITASRVLVRLCRQGRIMFDVEARRYRHRELFEAPADEEKYFPPDRRQELAAAFIADHKVRVASCNVEETKKVRSFKDPSSGAAKQKMTSKF